jgi:hypothetical protein
MRQPEPTTSSPPKHAPSPKPSETYPTTPNSRNVTPPHWPAIRGSFEEFPQSEEA